MGFITFLDRNFIIITGYGGLSRSQLNLLYVRILCIIFLRSDKTETFCALN